MPPIYIDEWELFDSKKNKAQYSETGLWLAFRGKTGWWIMGIINKRYNEIHNENHGRLFYGMLEDQEVGALISVVEDCKRKHGMEKIVGLLGFSDKDPQDFRSKDLNIPHL